MDGIKKSKSYTELSPVEKIWPDWEIVEEIGSGAFGTVYKAVRHEFGENFYSAIKVITVPALNEKLSAASSFTGRGTEDEDIFFEQITTDCAAEISAMSRLQGNSHIVSIQDFSVMRRGKETRWDICIRMELLQSLEDYLVDRESLSEEEICQIGIEMCDALIQCEKEHLMHRDIKPANIFVTKHGSFKLGDFGIAKHLEKTLSARSLKGSPDYIAPEIYNGREYGPNVDIYSLGLLLYFLSNGNRMPFLPYDKALPSYNDRADAFFRRINGEPLPPPRCASKSLCDVILHACAYSPAERYRSAKEMQDALVSCRKGESGTASTKPATSRDPSKFVAITAVLAAAGTAAAIAFSIPRTLDQPVHTPIESAGSSGTHASAITPPVESSLTAQNTVSYNTKGSVRIINKKYSESIEFERLAARFEDESGIKSSVVSPSPSAYSDVLEESLTGSNEDPTLFMLGGQGDFDKYAFECLDLTEVPVTEELIGEEYRLLGTNQKTYGIACLVESYGLTVNTRLLEKAGYSPADITCFDALKSIAEDITKRKDALGFSAFTCPTVGSSNGSYRLAEHAAAVPLYYELQDNDFNVGIILHGTYLDQFRKYVDLILDNSTVPRQEAVGHTLEEARNEFLSEKAVFHQDGSWSVDGLQSALRKQAAVLPLYMGMPGEESQGVNITWSYYWCVNKHASDDDIEATLQFLQWIATSEEALDIQAKDMGYLVPYRKASTSSIPGNIYLETLQQDKANGKTPVQQYYRYGDADSWSAKINQALEAYIENSENWEAVRSAFISLW